MSVTLRKLALKRDPTVPVGVASPLHLDCPCGTTVQIADVGEVFICRGCGAEYDRAGWLFHPREIT